MPMLHVQVDKDVSMKAVDGDDAQHRKVNEHHNVV
jgi:hypothetical protein